MVDFAAFLAALVSNPALIVITVLVICMLVVNGATNATNAIGAAIATRSISPRAGIVMGALCNFAGLMVMTLVSAAVADTIGHLVNFNGEAGSALPALAATMLAIVVWSLIAWRLGVPVSHTHALVAGLAGAAVAVQGLVGLDMGQWGKVAFGLVISSICGFALGWLFSLGAKKAFSGVKRSSANRAFGVANVIAAGLLAFMHGAQDGQKFMAVAVLGMALAVGLDGIYGDYPLWLLVFSALCLAAGSCIGGKKIIKTTAMDMVDLERYQGFAASLATGACLLAASLSGVPVSTTHTKTTAMMGAGAARRVKSVKWGIAGNVVAVWLLTFPCCAALGWVFAKLFLCIL